MKDLPVAMRPREKLLSMGASALADAELLALLLRTGLQGHGVLQMAQGMLDELGGMAGLLHAPPAKLTRIRGLGPAKRAELLAVAEMARRGLNGQLREAPVFESPQAVRDYLQWRIGALPHEVFSVLFLDAQHRLVADEEMFRGTLNQTSVYPRGGQARPGAQRGGRDPGAQPPVGRAGALAGGRAAHADAQEQPVAGGCSRAGPLRGRASRGGVVRRTRIALKVL